jgi:hypothetical protein
MNLNGAMVAAEVEDIGTGVKQYVFHFAWPVEFTSASNKPKAKLDHHYRLTQDNVGDGIIRAIMETLRRR